MFFSMFWYFLQTQIYHAPSHTLENRSMTGFGVSILCWSNYYYVYMYAETHSSGRATCKHTADTPVRWRLRISNNPHDQAMSHRMRINNSETITFFTTDLYDETTAQEFEKRRLQTSNQRWFTAYECEWLPHCGIHACSVGRACGHLLMTTLKMARSHTLWLSKLLFV